MASSTALSCFSSSSRLLGWDFFAPAADAFAVDLLEGLTDAPGGGTGLGRDLVVLEANTGTLGTGGFGLSTAINGKENL